MNISFKWIGGASWILYADDIKIICDPVLCPKDSIHDYKYFKSKRVNAPFFEKSDLENTDIWLFTHGHSDHCDLSDFQPIESASKIVCDSSAAKRLNSYNLNPMRILKWNEDIYFSFKNNITIKIKAVPAIHGKNIIKGNLVGNGNGYLINISNKSNTFSIYVSGDTLPVKKTISIIQKEDIDLFIANAGSAHVGKGLLSKIIGRITMNIEDVLYFKKKISAKMTIPVHWDAFAHYQEKDIKDFCKNKDLKYIMPGKTIKII